MATVNAKSLYPATFTEAEVITKGDTVKLVNGQYTPIGEYVVKADEMLGLGRGGYSSQHDAIGRFYALFKDSSGQSVLAGKLRIMLLSSQDMPIGSKPVYLDVDLSALTTGEKIPADRFVLPFDNTMLSEDKKVQFLIKVTGGVDVTLSKTNSKVLFDVTRVLV